MDSLSDERDGRDNVGSIRVASENVKRVDGAGGAEDGARGWSGAAKTEARRLLNQPPFGEAEGLVAGDDDVNLLAWSLPAPLLAIADPCDHPLSEGFPLLGELLDARP